MYVCHIRCCKISCSETKLAADLWVHGVINFESSLYLMRLRRRHLLVYNMSQGTLEADIMRYSKVWHSYDEVSLCFFLQKQRDNIILNNRHTCALPVTYEIIIIIM